nr:S8 family serine peptidase [Metabacillus kandeliae]
MIVSAAFQSGYAQAGQSSQISNAEEILKGLSEEQRQALKQLEASPGFTVDPKIDTSSGKPVSIIVEFNQEPALVQVKKEAAKGKKASLSMAASKVEASHQEFRSFLEQLKASKSFPASGSGKAEIKREYKNAFNGVSMTMPGAAVQELLRSGTVKRIWSDESIKLSLPAGAKSDKPEFNESLPQIGADKLHSEHIEGQGIKVGVIDTGIDYNHPDLTGAYKGFRAEDGKDPKQVDPNSVKGWDFVGNDADPMEATYKDWKDSKQPEISPQTGEPYYTFHGTHVSGTIAGQKKNNVDYAVEGVAPEADLYVYRVLGPYGAGKAADVLAGIDKAVKDGMNVINLSLGISVNDPLYPTSIAINNAMLSGVTSVVASGNDGPNEKTVGSPGTSALGITVGASDVTMAIPAFTATAGEHTFNQMKLLGKNFKDDIAAFEGKTYPIVAAGLGKPADFEGKDAAGKIALIKRGDIPFDEKIKNAKNAGAAAVIIYNNTEGDIPAYLGENASYIPAFQLQQADGESLSKLSDPSLVFGKMTALNTGGDSLADFSSRGPVNANDDIKPDIVAPGVSIFSAYPEFMNSPEEGIDYSTAYARLQGTSMATPHIAGTAALILQEHPDYDPFEVKAALMNTAVKLKKDYSVNEAGAGRVDAYHAVHASQIAEIHDTAENTDNNGQVVTIEDKTGSLSFGTHYKEKGLAINDSRRLTIENNSGAKAVYQTEVEFSAAHNGIQDAAGNHVQLTLPDSISAEASKTAAADIKISVPDTAALGWYEGYIHLKSGQVSTISIPFSIRVTDKGIAYTKLDPPSATNDTTYHQYFSPGAPMFFKLKSPMKYLDVVIKDAKTGKALGIAGSLNASSMKPDRDYVLAFAFRGLVYPFTGDIDQPVSDSPAYLPEKEYTIDVIGQDEEGAVYHSSNTAIVDNTPPETSFDVKPGVVEMDNSMLTDEDGYHALWVHGKVTDSTVTSLQAKGVPYTQSSNTVGYYENGVPFIRGFLDVADNGDVKFGVLPEEYEKPYQLQIFPWDMATAADIYTAPRFVFLKKGTEYAETSYNKDAVKLNDRITMTVNVKNVKQFVSGEYTVNSVYDDTFKFEKVTVNKAFQELAEKRGIKINLKSPQVKDNLAKVGAVLSKKGFEGLNGNFPFLDVTYKVNSDTYYYSHAAFKVDQFSYLKADNVHPGQIPAYSLTNFAFHSKHSRVSGYIFPEAFMTPGGYLDNKYNAASLGAAVYVKGKDGKKYNGELDARGQYTVTGVPASDKFYTVYAEVPGHLTQVEKVMLGKERNGELHGISSRIVLNTNQAGDVNQDELIDIRDVQLLVQHYGEQGPEVKNLDINQDGTINETDVRFAEKNFLQIGSEAKPHAKPLEKIGGKGLDELLSDIGLTPSNK